MKWAPEEVQENRNVDYIVRIRFKKDPVAEDYCPKSTQPRRKRNDDSDEDADHCKDGNGQKQADAICLDKGSTVKFVALGSSQDRKFVLEGKGGTAFPFTCTPSASRYTKKKKCDVPAEISDFAYVIKTETCTLDPRIIINEAQMN